MDVIGDIAEVVFGTALGLAILAWWGWVGYALYKGFSWFWKPQGH